MMLIALLFTLVAAAVIYIKWSYTYWKRKNVPYIKPKFPFGTTENPWSVKTYIGTRIKAYYDNLKLQGHKHGGLYSIHKPTYLPIDLEYIKNIMSKDFQYFTDHGLYYNEKDNPLSVNLMNIGGQRWRNLRRKITPAFTSGKVKLMFQCFLECTNELVITVQRFKEKNEPIDVKDIMGCFTTDIIGRCAFGIDCNSFKDPDNNFTKHVKEILEIPTKFQAIKIGIALVNHNLGQLLGITLSTTKVINFFMKTIKDTVKYREQEDCIRKDFLQVLIDIKNQGGEDSLTLNEVAAQVFVFLLAGYETSATALTFGLFELALNNDIQERVRNEINTILKKHNDEITYDFIMELKYLNQIIDETLRKYPSFPIIPRKCVKNYKIPNTNVIIEKGCPILIPVFALHYDAAYFPDPDKFDPERFSEEEKGKIIPYSYMPFGEGPRTCVGSRFGLMQVKLGLVMLLKNFKFSINSKTKIPLVIDPSMLVLTLKEPIWLNVE